VVRDHDELHDALLTLEAVPRSEQWQTWFDELVVRKRATAMTIGNEVLWVPAERLSLVRMAYPDGVLLHAIDAVDRRTATDREAAVTEIVRGWLESIGPVTAPALASRLALPLEAIDTAMVRLESEGQILRGRFTPGRGASADIEWCNRRLLARIHSLTLGRLRREIQPVTSAEFLRFLFRWQHLAPGTQLHGVDGALQIIQQLQGYEISASAWELQVLARRVSRYEPELLDRLCLAGEVIWGRLSPHPAFEPVTPDTGVNGSNGRANRRVRPTRIAPVAIFLREDAGWLLEQAPQDSTPLEMTALSHPAREVFDALARRGASFLPDLAKATGRLTSEVEDGLWELTAAGLVTADGFENLRALIDPKRRRGEGRERLRRPRHAAGRWDLLHRSFESDGGGEALRDPATAGVPIPRVEAFARQLLRRWGVVFRDLVARETLAPPWRDLLMTLRRMEARGEIRGGRFVSGFLGEQFALPEAIEALRAIRRMDPGHLPLAVPAADPLNLSGILLPGPRISALANVRVELVSAEVLSA
jgi:ATP-dependent Lhr-like helicase